MVKKFITLFLTGFVQVFLVSVNVYQVAHQKYLGAFIVGFFISLIWCFNIRSIAFGNWLDRLAYCLGAAFGTSCGILITNLYYETTLLYGIH